MRVARRFSGLTATLWIAGLALLLQMLVPAGFMLEPAGNGWGGRLVSCSGIQTFAPEQTAHGDHRREKAPRGQEIAPCVFAGIAIPHLPEGGALEVAHTVKTGLTRAISGEAGNIPAPSGMPAPPPPSQGPPRAFA